MTSRRSRKQRGAIGQRVCDVCRREQTKAPGPGTVRRGVAGAARCDRRVRSQFAAAAPLVCNAIARPVHPDNIRPNERPGTAAGARNQFSGTRRNGSNRNEPSRGSGGPRESNERKQNRKRGGGVEKKDTTVNEPAPVYPVRCVCADSVCLNGYARVFHERVVHPADRNGAEVLD